ncbi:aspartic peptidase domain-containing protein [Gamsiella multidivaricata]|uniref:aspartic peptidase domain-containing protein n=1 Tax=Gamsiella multidivaricata TaxID=101098 RepID=UPI00221F16DC|nr:aspartic peptidase domain-containing protein [Gamsiella multidivaricata]KAI7822317.1 aspartic peptidase domain-containing protein [Gamsiella multidivaricata]
MAQSQPWPVYRTSRKLYTTTDVPTDPQLVPQRISTLSAARSYGFLLLFLIFNATLTSPSLAATFEVMVSKPVIQSDPFINAASRSVLGQGGSKLFTSKYLGNSVVTNAKNLGYSGTMILGDPPQSFEVIFDTGSDMIVITSNKCQGLHCSDMAHYTCISCAKTLYSYNISYGDGTWGSGPIVTDKVTIGGLDIKNQQILDVTRSGLDLSSYGPGISGLVGLMPSSPVLNAIPPLATIYKSKLLDMNVFSVYLTSTLKKNQGGSFLFGGIDRTKFTGSLNQVPISTTPSVREGMWYIDADNAFVGETSVVGYTKSPWLFDTGTSFIAVPTSFARAFHAEIPGSAYSATDQVYTLPCTGNMTFGISFNGVKYEVPYLDYVAIAGGESPLCVSLVMPLENYEMYILGDPFLRQVYAVYDFTPGASRIGLAKINVTNASLGDEGLSGEPMPGGIDIIPVQLSIGLGRFETLAMSRTTSSMATGLSIIAMIMAMFT